MWERVKEVFHQALKRPAEEREEFLDATCGDDDALRSEVGALLVSHDEIGDDSLLSKSKSSESREGRVFPVEGPGSVIGRYKPLEEIGEGGMGVVYLAQQEQPVRRKVALKIIKLGMDTKEVIARFEAERQALAIMDHANIAKVFDAGTTELGRPYFVMEHIPGISITDYCDQQRLNAEERLRLFIPVCHAIHHAHQKGIIHRDVKPSNVLVTVQDGKPVPKVIDFGVAKATNQRLTEKTVFTEHGVLIGTPVYMSPEQADMAGLNVDTTTDVYSLGALLYELLAGAPPFDSMSLREAGFEAIQRMIREVEPPKPSTRFSGLGDEGTTVAERRRTEPAALARKIRGELDWIIMRAMEKDRSRRYQSASEFAADIERYLHDEPVEAGPPTTTYRMRKFVRRNKTGVGLATAAVVIIVAFAVTMTVQADRIARERDRAQLEARRGRVEAELVQAIFLEDVDYRDGQAEVDDYALLARELWELHQQSLAGDTAGLALCAVNMLPLLDLFQIFDEEEVDKTELLRLREEIEPVALGLIDQAVADRDTSIIATLDFMIHYMRDREINGEALFEVVAQLYRDAIALSRETLSPDDLNLNQHIERFAQYLEKKGPQVLDEDRVTDAEPILREALQLLREINASVERYAVTQGNLGECLARLNRYSEAEPLLLESLEVLGTRDERLPVIELYRSWGKPEKVDEFRKDLLVESVREIGLVGTPEVQRLWGARGFSAMFEGLSVWVFNGLGPAKWAWTFDPDASDGIKLHEPPYVPDGSRALLPLTPDEKAFNDAQRTSETSRKWILAPGPVIADPDRDRALVVYTKSLKVPGRFDEYAGRSLAVWEHPDSSVVRPILRRDTKYPTLLCQGDELRLGTGAVVEDGFLYLYDAEGVSCEVARAPLAEALDRSAWRFYAGNERWITDGDSAVNISDGGTCGMLSVHWNDYLGKYLAVHCRPGDEGVFFQTADRPEGPWSPSRRILKGVPTDHGGNQGLIAHPEFSRAGGRIEYITYSRPTATFKSEIRLVEITFK